MCWCTVLFLVVLRVVTGWHFFNEGRDHYFDEKWSSAGFLKGAVGPFAGTARSMLPNNHGWEALVAKPFTSDEYKEAHAFYNANTPSSEMVKLADIWKKKEADKSSKEPKQEKPTILDHEYPLYGNPIYGAWAKQVRDDWLGTLANVSGHYGWKEPAPAAAKPEAKPAEPAPTNDSKPAASSTPATDSKPPKPPVPANDIKAPATDSKQPAESVPQNDKQKSNEQVRASDDQVSATEQYFTAAGDQPAKPAAAAANPAIPAGGEKEYAQRMLETYLKLLEQKLAIHEKNLFEYRAELGRLEKMQAEPFAQDLPYEVARIADKKKELAGKATPWLNDLLGLDDGFKAILNKAAGPELSKSKPYAWPEANYKKIDRVVIWLLIIGGACLMLGLFTRLAATACGVFLLSVVLLQPFWVPEANTTYGYYQWAEMIALFTIATTGIGRYFGLDFFLHKLFGGSPTSEQVAVVNKKK